MKIFSILLSLLLSGCHNGGMRFVAPSLSEVSKVTAHLYNRPDGGVDIDSFAVPKSDQKAFLEILNGAREESDPRKWQVLGNIEISHAAGSVTAGLFWTGEQLGAFRVNDKYYRSGSDNAFIQLISVSNKKRTEQAESEQAVSPASQAK